MTGEFGQEGDPGDPGLQGDEGFAVRQNKEKPVENKTNYLYRLKKTQTFPYSPPLCSLVL